MQLQESKASEVSLQEKIVKEKQKYSDLLGKYEELQESKSSEASLQEKILKEKQKYSDLLGKYEELQSSLSLGNEVQTELTKFEVTMENVTVSLEKVEVIKKYWSDKVCIQLVANDGVDKQIVCLLAGYHSLGNFCWLMSWVDFTMNNKSGLYYMISSALLQ